jgi:hypothetical protein
MMSKRHKDYIVGILCSLDIEHAAMILFLDKEHEKLPLHKQDQNVYTLGSIDGLDVVIASPPDGTPDTIPAAVTTRDVIRSFPKIKFWLLVGTGSALPSPSHDVRLGDVVVGCLPSGHSAVTRFYDPEFALREKTFTNLEWDAELPLALSTAVLRLESQEEHEGWGLSRDMSQTMELHPWTRELYKFPGQGRDLLFQAHYQHSQPGKSCSTCDSSKLVVRRPRTHEGSVIHCGGIATSNHVLEDTSFRDFITKELRAICFNSEGRASMGGTAHLMIRGMADYADTHRSREWTDYAALAASAYAKRLLSALAMTKNKAKATANSPMTKFSSSTIRTDIDDRASMSLNTFVGTSREGDPGVRISAAERVAQVLVSDGRLRSVCSTAVLRMERVMLHRNIFVALGVLASALKKQLQTALLLGLRWLFSRHRSQVATCITEMIRGRADSFDQFALDSISNKSLRRLLNNRFPAANVVNATSTIARSEETPTMNPKGFDVETQECPDDTILTDLTQLEKILCQGPGFRDMLCTLKELLLPPVHVLLDNVLRQHFASEERGSTITCVIEWELLQFVNTEGLCADDIDYLFTLSGDFRQAHADPLADNRVWMTGKELLETLKICVAAASKKIFEPVFTRPDTRVSPAHQTQIQLFTANSESGKEYALANITGTFSYIVTIVYQLAWLTATLRIPTENTLTVSCIKFHSHRAQTGESLNRVFRMSLWEQEKVPQPDDEPGQCWTQLFTRSVLAYGFPFSAKNRPKVMRGLEVPFDIMASFAGVRFPLSLGERLIFASETNVLVPEICSEDSIQWHFDTIENVVGRAATISKAQAPGLEKTDASKLRKCRAFLGYSKFSEVVMGTTEFCDVKITTCEVPRTGPCLTFKNEGPLSVSTSAKGYFTANLGTTWKFKKGEMAQIEGSRLSLDDVLKRSARAPALLYDDRRCIAFLLSELSIVLQVAATRLRNDSKLAASQIPRAIASSDGGTAAYEAVRAAKNLEVQFGTGESKKYPDIVREFIDQLEQRKIQKRINQSFSEISLRKGLRGWNYTDIQDRCFEFWERESPAHFFESRPVWWQLFKDSSVTILFGGDMSQPIRICQNQESPYCTSWDTIPTGHHLLLANVRELKELMSRVNIAGSSHSKRLMLTADLAWARPTNSRLFDMNCIPGGRCNPLQTMRNPKTLWLKERDLLLTRSLDYLPQPGQLELEGSVLFADDPRAIKDRPCQLTNPHRETPEFKMRFVILAILLPMFSIMAYNFVGSNYRSLLTIFETGGFK